MVALKEAHVLDPARVDRELGIIYGVRVLGPNSRNGRTYTLDAMTEALPLYDGCPVNLDHPKPNDRTGRPVATRFGELRSPRIVNGGITADLHYLKSHSQAEFVLEVAETKPRLLGLSHVAEGETKHRNGGAVVERIRAVHSVDIVSDPATNTSLFEHREPSDYPEALRAFKQGARVKATVITPDSHRRELASLRESTARLTENLSVANETYDVQLKQVCDVINDPKPISAHDRLLKIKDIISRQTMPNVAREKEDERRENPPVEYPKTRESFVRQLRR